MKLQLAIGLTLLVGCSKPAVSNKAQDSPAATRQLSGQVFIVLKSRETLKLSLVPVALVESNAAAAYITARRAEFNARVDALEQAIKDIDSRLAEISTNTLEVAAVTAGSLSFQKHEQAVAIKKNLDAAWESFTPAQRNTARATYQKASAENDAAYAKAEQARLAAAPIRKQADALRAERLSFDEQRHKIRFVEYLFENNATPLPSIAVTETDADGKFTFQVSARSNYVLVAKSSRQIIDETEDYQWLVPVTDSVVNLHNANLFSEAVLDIVNK